MTISVTLNTVSYDLPTTGDDTWGDAVSDYLVALATGVLSKAGGAFTLTGEVDFGGSYGLKSISYKSRGTVSTAGVVRLANAESVGWSTELGYVSGVTSAIQTQIDTKAATASTLAQFAATTSAQLAGVVSDETGSGALVFATSPTLVTPVLGVAAATSINKVVFTAPASAATLTLADGKTLTVSNTLTFTGTDTASVAFGAGGTVAYLANKLSAFAATTSDELRGVISDETGSGGGLVFATSPTIASPTVSGTLLLQNAAGSQPELHFSEDPDNGTAKVAIKAPADLSGGDYTLTLPPDNGAANQVLQTDGNGVTSWATVAASISGSRGDLIRQGVASDEKFTAKTDNRVVRGDGTDVVLGQVDDPDFFTAGAAAGAATIGIVTTGTQSFGGAKTFVGATSLGSGNTGIYVKVLTGTTAATEGGTVNIAHGLTSTKIVGWTVYVAYASGSGIGELNSRVAGYQFYSELVATDFRIDNHATLSENILSKTIYIVVTYTD